MAFPQPRCRTLQSLHRQQTNDLNEASHSLDGPGAVDDVAADHARVISELFRSHNRALVGFLAARLNSEAEAQEIAQEAYVRLLQLQETKASGFLRAYLFRIAANLAIDRMRHRGVVSRAPMAELFEEWLDTPGPDQHALTDAELRRVAKALRMLPREVSSVFVMHVVEGRSLQQIARETKVSDRMLRYRVARALAHCRAYLDAGEGIDGTD